MTFIEDMRTRLLGAKRVLGNIRNSVVAISDAIAYCLADGISRLSVVSIIPLKPADALLGKHLPGRRQPVKAASREAGSRTRQPRRGVAGPARLASSSQGPLFRLQPQPALSAQAPFDAAVIAHEAGDVLPDALVEYGLPRHQTEAEPTITTEGLDHREPAAG
jgi:hypothetical protein